MHYDEEHDVQIRQIHRAFVEQTDKYTFDTDTYMTFLQIKDEGEQEEFILANARWVEGNMEVVDLMETIEVDVEDLA
jgi:hypothetical protein